MSFDLVEMTRLVQAHGPVTRVVVADIAGSAPREVGAAMMVWADGQHGTIGGGALEFEAAAKARAMIAGGTHARFERMPLGPSLGQCCGGVVGLLTEIWDNTDLASVTGDLCVRPLPGKGGDMPLAVHRLQKRARSEGCLTRARLVQGWFVEPIARPEREIWVWGAGHVGRAMIDVLRVLPGLRLVWVDVAEDRFPPLPPGVEQRLAKNPAELVTSAPANAEHFVLTFSHALDLEICHRLLGRGFARLGLIGSATKWARFRSRLAALGHAPSLIDTIACPIGDPSLGKHPQAIAIGVAAEILKKTDEENGVNGEGRQRALGERER